MNKGRQPICVYDRSWLTIARKKAGYSTQEKAAAAVGISTAYYNRLESGIYDPSVKIAGKIAQKFGFDISRFVTERKIV